MLYLKECSKCKILQNVDQFYKHKTCYLGISTICKLCQKKRYEIYYKEYGQRNNDRKKVIVKCETCGHEYSKNSKASHLKTKKHNNNNNNDNNDNNNNDNNI